MSALLRGLAARLPTLARWSERLGARLGRPPADPGQARASDLTPASQRPDQATLLDRAQSWCRHFDRRTLRERVLLSVAVLALLLQLVDALWLTPAWRDWRAARQERLQAQTALTALDASVSNVTARAGAEQQQLQNELRQLRARHADTATDPPPTDTANAAGAVPPAGKSGLVAARDMLPLLEQLLQNHAGLKLRHFQSLGHTPLGRAPAALAPNNRPPAASAAAAAKPNSATAVTSSAASPSAPIYRHGVELTLEGSYADLVAYLQAVEALPQRLLWGSLQLKVEEYPRVSMTLRLYTLSLDSRWVEL